MIYSRTRKCTSCGFAHVEQVQVHGHFDGWEESQLRMAPMECPFCLHVLGMREVLKARVDTVSKNWGSLRKAASGLGIDPGYLSRIRAGTKKASKETLAKLGMERVNFYRSVI